MCFVLDGMENWFDLASHRSETIGTSLFLNLSFGRDLFDLGILRKKLCDSGESM